MYVHFIILLYIVSLYGIFFVHLYNILYHVIL